MKEELIRCGRALRGVWWEIWLAGALWIVVTIAPAVPFLRPAQFSYAMLAAGFGCGLWAGRKRWHR